MNSAMPWVKIYTEFVDDAKFAGCTDSVKLRFIQLTLIAGECDADGDLKAGGEWLNIDQIAWRLRVMHDQLEADIAALLALGVVARTKAGLRVVNFDKRQGRSQSVKREQWRERQERHRSVTRDSRVTHALVTPLDKEGDKDKEKSTEGAAKRTPRKKDNGASAPPPRNPLFDAVAEITKSNPALQGGMIAKIANQLKAVGATPEQVTRFGKWWSVCDWRGIKGELPLLTQITPMWQRAIEWDGARPKLPAGAPRSNGRTHMRGQVQYTDEQRKAAEEQARRVLAGEEAE